MATDIKFLSPATEIIALTAYSNTQHLLKAIEIGISHYILKPIDTEQIFRVIDAALALIRSRRAIDRQNEMIRNLIAELSKKATELEIANQELEAFNYTVAHDLRAPMTTISGFAQVLLNYYASDMDCSGKEYLLVINREILRINNLISALLKFSKYSKKNVHKSWTDISRMANEIKDTLLATDPGRHVEFSVSEGISGYCDSDLMRIVLENLLANAWKFSAMSENARIEIGTITKEEGLIYFVRDNGVGFEVQDAEKLFIPFQRLENETEFEGYGIGLSTAYRIIHRHGGRIWADGETGKGATFYFTL
jgi:light-regulated signal transduction histidine kinase (bacteriophytochrome)